MPIGRTEHNPSHPYLVAAKDVLWLAWTEFDGERTAVHAKSSHDNGRTWSSPHLIAETLDASDHPLLLSKGAQVFLSWQAQREGYRFVPLEDLP